MTECVQQQQKDWWPVSRTLAAVQIRLSRPRTRARPATEAATPRGRRSRHCARTPSPCLRVSVTVAVVDSGDSQSAAVALCLPIVVSRSIQNPLLYLSPYRGPLKRENYSSTHCMSFGSASGTSGTDNCLPDSSIRTP